MSLCLSLEDLSLWAPTSALAKACFGRLSKPARDLCRATAEGKWNVSINSQPADNQTAEARCQAWADTVNCSTHALRGICPEAEMDALAKEQWTAYRGQGFCKVGFVPKGKAATSAVVILVSLMLAILLLMAIIWILLVLTRHEVTTESVEKPTTELNTVNAMVTCMSINGPSKARLELQQSQLKQEQQSKLLLKSSRLGVKSMKKSIKSTLSATKSHPKSLLKSSIAGTGKSQRKSTPSKRNAC